MIVDGHMPAYNQAAMRAQTALTARSDGEQGEMLPQGGGDFVAPRIE